VPLRELLEEVVEVAHPGAGPAMTIDVPAALAVRADRAQLRRALMNLLHNAIAAAGPAGRVTLAARAGADGVVVCEVRDSGAGVPADLRAKIFEPFFTTREKGTGLGLAFVAANGRARSRATTAARSPWPRRPRAVRDSSFACPPPDGVSLRGCRASSSSTTTRPCARAWPPRSGAWATRW
jgi:hypothetical protein